MSKTTKYGGLDVLVGTVTGVAIDHNNRGKGVLVGAAVAGATTAGHSYYIDKRGAELCRQMEDTGMEAQRQGDDIKPIMPGDIIFATDSTNIAPSLYAPLNNLANSLEQCNQNAVETVGYTDSTSSHQHNMDLSQRHAQNVVDYLTTQGVDGTRLSTRSTDPSQPITSNSTADGRAQNWRVEVNLRLVPGTQGPAQIQSQY